MIDENLNPWILEMNCKFPDFGTKILFKKSIFLLFLIYNFYISIIIIIIIISENIRPNKDFILNIYKANFFLNYYFHYLKYEFLQFKLYELE